MKNRLTNSFQKRITLAAIASSIITIFTEIIVIFVMKELEIWFLKHQYRSELINREGVDPTFKLVILVILGIAVFCISISLCLRSCLRYVRELSKGIEVISRGDLNAPIPIRGNDEFTNIAMKLNTMTEEIKILMAREREAENTKNDLITSVAHDLRTPLTSIIGYLQLIRSNPQLEQETKYQYVEIAYNKAKRLEKLTNDLFGFAKLNHGEMTMNPGMLDIVKLLGQLLDEFYPSFQEKELECEFTSSQPSIIIEADGNLLARLFDNLINNAIKYGADGKRVRVFIGKKNEIITIRVINYGKVIPSHELGNIFQKFYRVDPSRSQDTGGTGLGLAIARSVVEMHCGLIEARSDLHETVFEVQLHTRLGNIMKKFEK